MKAQRPSLERTPTLRGVPSASLRTGSDDEAISVIERLLRGVYTEHGRSARNDMRRQLFRCLQRGDILAALKLNGGNGTKTAWQLGLSSATLFRKLRAYNAETT